jgi:hypothetical protein
MTEQLNCFYYDRLGYDTINLVVLTNVTENV